MPPRQVVHLGGGSGGSRRERAQYLAARVLARLPDAIKVRLSGEPPVVVDGQRLDAQLQLIRSATRDREMPGLVEPSIDAGRARYRRQTQVFRGPVTAVGAVRDLDVGGAAGMRAARHYAPPRLPRAAATAPPLTVYFHGGGFVIGDLDTHDEPCRMLCRYGCTHVLSIAYRLAPEHPFPAAVDDAAAALAWAREHAADLGADPDRVTVAGDSAGGNLAAVISASRRALRPCAQLLIYPATDFDSERRSHELFASGFFITGRDIESFREHYVGSPRPSLRDPRLSPLYGQLSASLPPTLAAIAGFDPLRDDGEAYVAAVQAAGGRMRVLRFPSLGHGFIHMTGVAPAARRAMMQIAAEWRALLSPS